MVSGWSWILFCGGRILLIPAHSEVLLENIPMRQARITSRYAFRFIRSIATFGNAGKGLWWDHQDHRVRSGSRRLCRCCNACNAGQWLRNAPDLLGVRQQELLALLVLSAFGAVAVNRHPNIAQSGSAAGNGYAHAGESADGAPAGMNETTLRRELGREGHRVS